MLYVLCLQCYSLAVIGYRVATFNDCVDASKELQQVSGTGVLENLVSKFTTRACEQISEFNIDMFRIIYHVYMCELF